MQALKYSSHKKHIESEPKKYVSSELHFEKKIGKGQCRALSIVMFFNLRHQVPKSKR